jgi:hypothetical protein
MIAAIATAALAAGLAVPAGSGAGLDDAADTLLAWASASTPAHAAGGGTRAIVRYEWLDDAGARSDLGNGVLCNATGATDLSGAGIARLLQAYDRATGAALGDPQARCVLLGPVLAPPPRPPTVGDVWDLVRLPAPPISATPPGRGVTGFETHLWTTAPAARTVDVTVGPYRVHAVATPVGYSFDWGDGTVTAASGPGDRDHPAARHVYERKATYRIVVTTTWAATATFSGPGFSGHPLDIGRATTSTAAPYPVDEIRSVRVGE